MIITVASLKGGQAKTTTAVHVAALLREDAPTLLVDGDPNHSALNWHKRKGFPFEVCDERQAVKFSRNFAHIVFDTQARPSKEDLEILAGGCDQLIIPLTPDALSLDTLFSFTDSLKQLGAVEFKILLTIVPPKPATDGIFVRRTLEDSGFRPAEFSRLKRGGDGTCEAVIFWLSHQFECNDGKSFCRRTFTQEPR